MKFSIKKSLMQFQGIITIILLSIILGITFNFISPKGISLIYPYSNQTKISNDLFITFEDAKHFYENSSIIFLDSRSYENYSDGHIKNAQSFPYFEFDKYYNKLSNKLNKESIFIIYCGGESCNSSEKLAIKLMEKDYNNIRIFKSGWNLWTSAQLPIEKE